MNASLTYSNKLHVSTSGSKLASNDLPKSVPIGEDHPVAFSARPWLIVGDR
jgi:hypothetical protein